MIHRRVARRGPAVEPMLAALAREEPYRPRLDRVLRSVSDLLGHDRAFLYVPEPGGRRLHLEHSWQRPRLGLVRSAPDSDIAVAEGGAEWSVGAPPFEVTRSPEDQVVRIVASTAGPLCSFPLLVAEDGDRDGLVGLIRTGPADAHVPAGVAEAFGAVGGLLAAVVAGAHREERLARRLAAANARLEAGRRLAGSAVDPGGLIELLLGLAVASTGSEAGFVALRDRSGTLRVRAARGLARKTVDRLDLSPDAGLLDWSAAADGGALFLRAPEEAERLGIRSLLAVPLLGEREPLGVFALVDLAGPDRLDEHALELLAAFAEQIRLTVDNGRLFRSFADRYLETVQGLARTLDARRPDTHDHHEAVAAAATAIARELGLSEREVEWVRLAGLVHDVGLAGATEGGWAADVQHPAVGASLLEHLPLAAEVADAVRTHHEWFDGWGFPDGVSGDEIPRGGRILAAAEFLVEMSTPDAVRPAWDEERLASELRQRSGSQFDPRVSATAERLVREGALLTTRDTPA